MEDQEKLNVLIIDDEQAHAEVVSEVLERVGYRCVIATSGKAGARKIESDDFDVIITDLKMPDMDGLALLRKARSESDNAEVVLMTGHGDVKTAVEAMKEGAASYLTKPIDMAELRAIVDKAAERSRLARANRELKRQLDEKFGFEGVIGNSSRMREVIDNLKKYAPTAVTTLIIGETGTGKELVARALHYNSPRKTKPFVAMNCTALNENLLEDELFGHEPGSFTGAERMRKGRFEAANGGTLFLDEVGDMPLSLQAKLLRVLENGEIFRIGSNDPIKVNVRLISATNRDLEGAIAAGAFRQDLYFRLKVATIKLPPLRERREDIPLLAAHFIREFNQKYEKKVTAIAEPVRKAMAAYEWKGNVRELRNLIETMIVQDTDGILGFDDMQDRDALGGAGPSSHAATSPAGLVGKPLAEVERYYIEQTLELTSGNREEAARMLGIGERTLYRIIQDWKAQDKVRAAIAETSGDVAAAADKLGMKADALERKIKKWGMPVDEE
ncbi:MAG: sigma-54-dependent transcriptional regulator [Gemmataceae bacterium]